MSNPVESGSPPGPRSAAPPGPSIVLNPSTLSDRTSATNPTPAPPSHGALAVASPTRAESVRWSFAPNRASPRASKPTGICAAMRLRAPPVVAGPYLIWPAPVRTSTPSIRPAVGK